MTRETTSRWTATVWSINLRATEAKPDGAATGEVGACWSSAAADAAEEATSAAAANAAAGSVVRSVAGRRKGRMGAGAKTTGGRDAGDGEVGGTQASWNDGVDLAGPAQIASTHQAADSAPVRLVTLRGVSGTAVEQGGCGHARPGAKVPKGAARPCQCAIVHESRRRPGGVSSADEGGGRPRPLHFVALPSEARGDAQPAAQLLRRAAAEAARDHHVHLQRLRGDEGEAGVDVRAARRRSACATGTARPARRSSAGAASTTCPASPPARRPRSACRRRRGRDRCPASRPATAAAAAPTARWRAARAGSCDRGRRASPSSSRRRPARRRPAASRRRRRARATARRARRR